LLTRYYRPCVIYKRDDTDQYHPVRIFVGTYRGLIQPLSGSGIYAKGKNGEESTHRFYTDMGTPCEYGYEVTQFGINYIMNFTEQPKGISGTGHHKEILCSRFQ
jgi:hypothetical protein